LGDREQWRFRCNHRARPANSYNDKLTTSLRLTVTKVDKKNPVGWLTMVIGEFRCSRNKLRAMILAKADPSFSGPVTVSIVSDDGKTTYATGKLSGLTRTGKI